MVRPVAGALSTHVYLVIPCYHESLRLPTFLTELRDALDTLPFAVTLQIADDGSGSEETARLRSVVEEARSDYPALVAPLLELSHQGKGGTLLRAWKLAPANTTHYAFADADGAVSPGEIHRVLESFITPENQAAGTCAFAIRKRTPRTTIKRDPLRRFMGLTYYRLVRFILDTDVYDPACGFKILSQPFWQACGHLLTEREWALDIEILARIDHHGFPMEQYPVSWEEKAGSKIVRTDLWKTLKQVIAIKHRSLNWPLEKT